MSYAVIEVYGKTFEGENLHGCKLERKMVICGKTFTIACLFVVEWTTAKVSPVNVLPYMVLYDYNFIIQCTYAIACKNLLSL